MTIITILEALENTPARKEKEAILSANKDNELLKNILKYTYEPYWQYYIATLPESLPLKEETNTSPMLWYDYLLLLESLKDGSQRGNQGYKIVCDFLSNVDAQTQKWMRRVLDRHLNVGLTE
jgi:hypothetical protein